jgi:archaemetzincin
VKGVVVMSCGPVPAFAIDESCSILRHALGVSAIAFHGAIDPQFAFEAQRAQFNSTLLLRRIVERKPPHARRVLGLTAGDLFIPMLSFVFGQAQLGGPGAIVSLARLRQEFYGLPPDQELLSGRLRKEVLHELGHTLSLVHCPDPACVMSLATGIQQVDGKSSEYCESCRALIGAANLENNL